MRILLLNPPFNRTVLRDYYCSSVSKAGYLWHPIDLLAQSGRLSKKHEVRALDAVAGKTGPGRAARIINDYAPGLVFSLTSAATWREDFDFIEPLKKNIGFKAVLSGEIFLADPGRVLESNQWIDGALLNFTGPAIERFIEDDFDTLGDFAWRDNEGVHVRREPAKGVFKIGVPRHDLFADSAYNMPWQMHHPFATVMTDYGCPFKCDFCNSRTFGYAVRDLDEIKEELDFLSRKGIKQLFIKDMTFAASKPHASKFLETMISGEYGFRWNCYSRADVIDERLASMMRRAGCHLVQVGVESADDSLMEKHGKKIKVETVRNAFRILADAGVDVGAHFILGLPGDTLEGMRRTVELAVELDPVYASFNLAMPRLGASLDDTGWMDRPLDSSGSEPFYEVDGVSGDMLIAERNAALKRFYLRPAYLAKMLRSVKTPYQLLNLMKQAGGLAKNRLRSKNT